jgi:hypothetical protein
MRTTRRESVRLLTHNVDFLDDRKFPPDRNRNPGAIVLPGASGGDSILIRAIGQALCKRHT